MKRILKQIKFRKKNSILKMLHTHTYIYIKFIVSVTILTESKMDPNMKILVHIDFFL